MTEAGIWMSRRERKKRLHQPRGRRDCFGELVQIDGSHHWWFENRGPKCALLVYIDDATGRLLHLRFAGSENTFDYLMRRRPICRNGASLFLSFGIVDIRVEVIRGDQIEEGVRVRQELPAAPGWQQHILFPAKKLRDGGPCRARPKAAACHVH